MKDMGKIKQKFGKYDLSSFCVLCADWLVRKVSTSFSSAYARLLFRIFGVNCGRNFKADGCMKIRSPQAGAIVLGDNCKVNSRFGSNLIGGNGPTVLQCIGDGRICIGNHCGLSFVVISSRSEVRIGNHVQLGGNVRIFDHNYHSLNYEDRRDGQRDQMGIRSAPVCIGDDVFVGTNAIIIKGVSIGDRSIVGAGSVVVCNVPEDEVWGGNPARFIRKLI